MSDSRVSDDTQRRLQTLIRDIPDYPKPGILFKDITPLLAAPDAFAAATEAMGAPFVDAGITHVVAIESRGFILGGPIAQRLGAGFIPVRKPGKLRLVATGAGVDRGRRAGDRRHRGRHASIGRVARRPRRWVFLPHVPQLPARCVEARRQQRKIRPRFLIRRTVSVPLARLRS